MLLPAQAMLLIPVGCACSAAGLLLMKSAGDDRPDLPPWKSPKWMIGFLLLGVFATAVEVAVLGVLPLSVVAPFAGLTIVFSLLLASSGLLTTPAESLSRADIMCIALVLLGVTLVSAFGPHDSGAPSLAVLIVAYTRARFVVFVVVGFGAATFVLCPFGAALLGTSTLWPLLSAFAAASCGCLSQLFLKLFSTTVAALPTTLTPTLLALLGLICSAPLHLALLNKTLVGSSVAIAVPCYQFLLIVCTTAAGGILFDEFAAQTSAALSAYALGVATATAGLVALSFLTSSTELTDLEEGSSDDGDKSTHELQPVRDLPSPDGSTSDDGETPPPLFPSFRPGIEGAPYRRRMSMRRSSLVGGRRTSLRQSLVAGSSFGSGIGSFAAISGLSEASIVQHEEDPPPRGRQRAATWSEGLNGASDRGEAAARAAVERSAATARRSLTDRPRARERLLHSMSLTTVAESAGSPPRGSNRGTGSSSSRLSCGRPSSLDEVLGDGDEDD